jgi:hypothetical protein
MSPRAEEVIAFPIHNKENKLTETKDALIYKNHAKSIWEGKTDIKSKIHTTLAAGDNSERVKCIIVMIRPASEVLAYVRVSKYPAR